MPWIVEEGHGCPDFKPWAVVKVGGAKVGCHPSKEAATQQQKALYANQPKENSMPAIPAATRARSRATRLRALARHLQMSRRADLAPLLLQLASRQDAAANGDWDEDGSHLAQAADAALDEALEAFQGGQVDQGVALVVSAAASVDALLEAMNLSDADEVQPDANANSRRPVGSTRATPPADTHGEERHNAHDIGFLHEVAGQLQGGIGAAHAVIRQGIHPDTAALAQSLLSTNTDHLVTAAKLQQRLAPASGAVVAGSASGTSGHGQGGGDGGGRSRPQVVRSALAMPAQERDAREVARSGEAIRAFDFEVAPHSDGLILEGYAAVFNSPTRIDSWEGEFDETIAPGAFAETLRGKLPVLMFEHGKHPLIGSMPLGIIQRAGEDSKGVHIQARLSDNWLIQPVRDAVRDGAVTGMSFRFTVPEGGDKWTERKGSVPLRTVSSVEVRELGPVVFPAYEPTTAAIRSALDHLPDLTGRPDARSAGGGDSSDAQPGNGEASASSFALHTRDRVLRLKRIL